ETDAGPFNVTITATDDGEGTLTDTQNIQVGVNNVIENTAPVLGADVVTAIDENTTVVGTYAATDVDGDNISYSLSGADAALFNISATGELSFKVAPDYETDAGPFNVTITATDDGEGTLTDTQNIQVGVNNVIENTAPALTITLINNFIEDSGAAVGDVVASYTTSDEDGDTVTVNLSDTIHYALDGAGNVTLTVAGLALVNSGADLPAFTLTPNDGTVDGAPATADPSVTAVNDAPVNTVPGSQTVTEATQLFITGLSTSDVDAGSKDIQYTLSVGDGTLTVGAVGAATVVGSGTGTVVIAGTVSEINAVLSATDNVSYTSNDDFVGDETLTVTTSDLGNTGSGGTKTDVDTVTITVEEDVPIANDDRHGDDLNTNVATSGNVIDGTAGGSDAADTTHTDGPLAIQKFTYTDSVGNQQTIQFGVDAVSGTDATHGDYFAVQTEWGALTFYADGEYSYEAYQKTNYTFGVADTDDADVYAYSSFDYTAGLSLTNGIPDAADTLAATAAGLGVSGGSDGDSIGSDGTSNEFIVFNLGVSTTSAVLTTSKLDGNDNIRVSAYAEDGTYLGSVLDPTGFAVSASDFTATNASGSDFYYLAIGAADSSDVFFVTGLTITPTNINPGDIVDTVNYTVIDNDGDTASADLNLLPYTSPNAVPVANDDTATVDEGTTQTIDLVGNDTDADDAVDPGSIVIVSGPSNGTITVNSDGTVAYSHDGSETTADSFTYTVRDQLGQLSNTATVNLTIAPQNDAPVLTDLASTLTYDEGDVAQLLDSTITLSDIDDTYLESATVKITGNYISGQDVLSISGGDLVTGVTATWDAVSGTLTLTADAADTITVAQFEAMLEAILYENTAVSPELDSSDRTISWTVNDGDTDSNVGTSIIEITASTEQQITAGDDTGSVVEDVDTDAVTAGVQLEQSGTLSTNFGDFNTAVNFTNSTHTSGVQLGNLVIDASGNWSFDIDNDAVQFLDEGETIVETYTVQTADGQDTQDITITITGADDVPQVSVPDNQINIAPDSTHTLSVGDFGFSDVDGSDKLISITVTSLETDGQLMHFDGSDWVAVTLNQVISAADIESGYLVFLPDAGENNSTAGDPDSYASFGFSVYDGTSSSDPATITYSVKNVLSVSDPLPVDEGASAVFVLELSSVRGADTILDLSVGGDVTADDYETPLQYRLQNADGSYTDWADVSSDQITVGAGLTKAEVKVKSVSDAIAGELEGLSLTASINGSATDMANTSATGSTTINDNPSLIINESSYISEGQVGVFEIGLTDVKASATLVTISFSGAAELGVDFDYSIDGGTTWITASSSVIAIPADADFIPSFDVYVRTTSDGLAELDEKLIINATSNDNGIANQGESVVAVTTIVDGVVLSMDEDGGSVTTPADSLYDYELLGSANNGTVVVNADGTLTYTPNPDFSGTDSFTYTKTNAVGQTTTAVATVNVTAVADVPTVTMSISEAIQGEEFTDQTNYIVNGSFENYSGTPSALDDGDETVGLLDWTTTSNGNNASELVNGFSGATGSYVFDTGAGSNKNVTLSQSINGLTAGETYVLSFDYGIPAGIDGGLKVIMNDGVSDIDITDLIFDGTQTADVAMSGVSFSFVAGATNSIRFEAYGNNNPADDAGIYIDNVSLTTQDPVQTYDYAINIDVELNDTDGSEFLQDILITSTDVPADAVLKLADGTAVSKVLNADGITFEWLVAAADLSGLILTLNQPSTAGSFNLTATAIAEELSNGDAAEASATVSATMPLAAANDAPRIGDGEILISNEASFSGTATNTIPTYFSEDEPNVFSWNVDDSILPNMVAGGEPVQLTYSVDSTGLIGTVTGETSAGTVFTLVITLDPVTGETSVSYTQDADLIGVETAVDGGLVLPGGGNSSDLVLGLEDADGNVVMDAVLTSENTIEGTTNHSVNTNSYYAGVDSNNMNPGDKLTLDFAAAGIAYPDGSGNTSQANYVGVMKIKLFNFDSASSSNPDELLITVTELDGDVYSFYISNADLDAEGFYTIQSPTGEPITKLEFLAGSSSSFKLGVESVTQISYDVDFDMQLSYAVTDGNGDTDSGRVTVTLDGDDAFIYDSNDRLIDGGNGEDTLMLMTSESINFGAVDDDRIRNMEVIDLNTDADGSNSAHTLGGLTLADVSGMTDADNELTILGDSGDTVALADDGASEWYLAGTETSGGISYDIYLHPEDSSVPLKIQQGIVVTNDSLELTGTAASDTLVGGASDDVLIGSQGDDSLTGGSGSDIFKWQLSDQGAVGTPAVDQVADLIEGVDVLDISDLLVGENTDNLTDYLHFEQDGPDTLVHISSEGGFAGDYATNSGQEDQTIRLQGVDLSGYGSDQQILDALKLSETLITD
ncbi:cadherin-like domain-containing protein, partial [Aestuariicella hydrocarbonica]|nr:cadherin-like domain-containing protein [Aestuariicella hydrocarbonica]